MITTLMVLPATRPPPLCPPIPFLAQVGMSRRVKRFPTLTKRTTPRLLQCLRKILTVFSSSVESLKRGVITTSKDKDKVPYTIVLVGEIGVGKTLILYLIANVIADNTMDHYDFDVIDRVNGQDGSNQSQTNTARLYEFTSKTA